MTGEIEITNCEKYHNHVNWVATHQRPALAFNIVAEHVVDALRPYFRDVESEDDYDELELREGDPWNAICAHINSFDLATQVAVIDGHPSYYDEHFGENQGMSLRVELEQSACVALRNGVADRLVERDILPVEEW